MKARIWITALAVASFAAAGLSTSAFASSVSVMSSSGQKTPCTPVDVTETHEGEIVLCDPSMSVDVERLSNISTSITPDPPANLNLPNPPGVDFLGPATTITVDQNGSPVKADFLEVCFKDPSASANVYRWWTTQDFQTWFKVSNMPGRWVFSLTFHKAGMDCTDNWLPGTYTIN